MAVKQGMEKPRLDPSVMAALIEGRLGAEERQRALDVIASSPPDYEWFVEASATFDSLRGEPDGEVVREDVTGIRGVLRHRRRWVRLAAAAAVAVVALPAIRLMQPKSTLDRALDQARLLAVGSRPLTERFGPDWAAGVGSGVRGTPTGMTEGLALQLGVGLADVEAAVAAGDAASRAEAARLVVRLLGQVPAGGPVAAMVRSAADAGDQRSVREAARAVEALVGSPAWLRAGSWLEVARLAALAGTVQRVLDRPEFGSVLGQVGPRADPLIDRLRAVASLPGPEAALRIGEVLESLLEARSGPR